MTEEEITEQEIIPVCDYCRQIQDEHDEKRAGYCLRMLQARFDRGQGPIGPGRARYRHHPSPGIIGLLHYKPTRYGSGRMDVEEFRWKATKRPITQVRRERRRKAKRARAARRLNRV